MTVRHWLPVLLLSFAALAPAQDDEWEERWTTDPSNEDPKWRKAFELRRAGDTEGAMALYREFLDANPDEISVVVSMGSCYAELGRLDDAETWWRKALELVPYQNFARIYLGRLLYHRGRFPEATEQFRFIDENPTRFREDVLASARSNLGKIALVQRRFSDADKHFRLVAEDGNAPKGKRNLARKGVKLTRRLRSTRFWARAKTPHLEAYFSPQLKQLDQRQPWLEKREQTYVRVCAALGLAFAEPLVMYVCEDDLDAEGLTGRDEIHTWKYSWWQIVTSFDGEPDHDLIHQLVARVSESRPGTMTMVEGLCCYLDGSGGDPHAEAKKMLAKGLFPRIDPGVTNGADVLVALHADQRRTLESVRPLARSFVAHVIERYGMERFLASYRNYNIVMVNPAWVHPETRARKWHAVLSEVFRRGLGHDLAKVEGDWLASLR